MRLLRQPSSLWLFKNQPAGFRIDEMHPRAGGAGYGHIAGTVALGRMVGDPSLHLEPRIRGCREVTLIRHSAGSFPRALADYILR